MCRNEPFCISIVHTAGRHPHCVATIERLDITNTPPKKSRTVFVRGAFFLHGGGGHPLAAVRTATETLRHREKKKQKTTTSAAKSVFPRFRFVVGVGGR